MAKMISRRWLRQAPQRSAGRRQRGAAAIIVTLVTMIIVSLIVLGFATISRREQRLTLDQQLSAQAFYAAESAVEDAKKVLQDALAAGRPLIGKQRCESNDAGGDYPVAGGTVIDDNNKVSYTCLRVDVSPASLAYDDVGEGNVIVPIKTSQPITRLDITWQPSGQPSGTPNTCPGGAASAFSPQPQWNCGYSVIRADLLPVGSSLNRANLSADTLSGFFVPTRIGGGGQISYAARKGQANAVAANCDTASYGSCRMSVGNLSGGQEYMLRLNSIYRSNRVIITAYQNDQPLDFQEGQAVVDATGRAQDVLRRIQVRLPIKPGAQGLLPTFAIQSNASLCKHFRLNKAYFNIPGDIVEPDTGNPMCVAKSDGAAPAPCTTNGEIALALDRSNSMNRFWRTRTALTKTKESVRRFIQNTAIANGNNRAAIVPFNDDSNVAVGLTFNQNDLVTYVNGMSASDGAEFLEPMEESRQEITDKRRAGAPRTIVFITDGVADDSEARIRAEADAIKNAGIRFYVVGIDGRTYTPSSTAPNEALLTDMANAGRYFLARSEAELDTILQDISDELACR